MSHKRYAAEPVSVFYTVRAKAPIDRREWLLASWPPGWRSGLADDGCLARHRAPRQAREPGRARVLSTLRRRRDLTDTSSSTPRLLARRFANISVKRQKRFPPIAGLAADSRGARAVFAVSPPRGPPLVPPALRGKRMAPWLTSAVFRCRRGWPSWSGPFAELGSPQGPQIVGLGGK